MADYSGTTSSVLEAEKERALYARQRDLIIDYIGENFDMLVGDGNVLDDYVSHEVDGETIRVKLKIRPKTPPGHPKAYALTRQRVIKRSDIVEFHKRTHGPVYDANTGEEVKPSPVHQVSWAALRAEIFDTTSDVSVSATYLETIQKYVTVDNVPSPRDMHPELPVVALKCRCLGPSTGPTLCEHLQFVYATGWERMSLIDKSQRETCILLPIGMGYTNIILRVFKEVDQDGKLTGKVVLFDYTRKGAAGDARPSLFTLAEEVTAYPADSSFINLGPDEGIIKAVRYVEDMIKSTEKYSTLVALAADDNNAHAKANLVCSRRHNRPVDRALMAQFQAGIRFGNPNRDNWLIACSYTAAVHGLCLPCYDATSASNNVPKL